MAAPRARGREEKEWKGNQVASGEKTKRGPWPTLGTLSFTNKFCIISSLKLWGEGEPLNKLTIF